MRISDWSSDVCSSDLCSFGGKRHLIAIVCVKLLQQRPGKRFQVVIKPAHLFSVSVQVNEAGSVRCKVKRLYIEVPVIFQLLPAVKYPGSNCFEVFARIIIFICDLLKLPGKGMDHLVLLIKKQ